MDLDERLERWERQVSALRRIMIDAIRLEDATTHIFWVTEQGSLGVKVVALSPLADCDEPTICVSVTPDR